jgi:hypothetical protein
MIDKWTPSEEDKQWTKNQIDSMVVGDTWSVSGALFEKTNDEELSLRHYPTESAIAISRIIKVCESIDYVTNIDEAQMIDDPMQAAQDAAKEWEDPESGIPLVNFDLANAEWILNAIPTQDAQGNSIIIDQWTVQITHPNPNGDAHEVIMSAMDYHTIAGDDIFFSWNGLRVIERGEAITLADKSDVILQMIEGNIIILGTKYIDGMSVMVVPPHMRGMMVSPNAAFKDEEE